MKPQHGELSMEQVFPRGLQPQVDLAKEGAKYDQGKTRIELFPGDVLFAISDILTFGAQKYADRNWEKGMAWSRCFGALMRHLWAWWQGKGPTNVNFALGEFDPETMRSHLWHAGCMLTFLIAYELRGIGTDDRPKREEKVLPFYREEIEHG